MTTFDFSCAQLEKWKSGLPDLPFGLNLLECVWETSSLLAYFVSADSNFNPPDMRLPVYSLNCNPEFALLVRDEANALSLWKRRDELQLKCAVMRVLDSAWVKSFSEIEPYHSIPKAVEISHYIIGCDDDFLHLISKQEPIVKLEGYANNEMLKRRVTPVVVEHMNEILIRN